MNKTMEYMAFGLPVITFDLKEARVSAMEAAVYVPSDDIIEFAKTIGRLLDDPERRQRMSAVGRERAETVLDWSRQVPAYIEMYARLTAPK